MKIIAHIAGLAAAGLLSATAAYANILVDQPEPYGGYYAGGFDWTKFTTALNANGGYTIGDVGNAAQVAAADAILIVARSNFVSTTTPTLEADEIANITSFLATGKRVVIVGDGAFFFNMWGESVINFASGNTATVGDNVNTDTSAIVANDLTAGVTTVHIQGAAIVTGGNGVALFDKNFATLWGDNLLTILDMNVLQDNPGPVFRDNVAAWLGASKATTGAVPEPATWALLIAGFAFAGASLRRRARTTVSFA